MPLRAPPLPAIAAGLLAAFIGFTSAFSVVLQGLTAVGASQAEAASGLMALSIAMGGCAIVLSLRFRMPISVAWSTPGAALLAGVGLPEGGFSTAVGAFLLSGLLIVAAGVVKPAGRLIAAIPASLANAMLAGIIFPLCIAPAKAIAADPLAGLGIAAIWVLVGRLHRLFAVPAAALAAILIILARGWPIGANLGSLLPHPVLVMPGFNLQAVVGIALPLFLVTMASQNIPGLTVLKVHGYAPPAGPLFAATGLFSLAAAPFGGHAVNLAAITAAICAGEEAGPDPARRYWSGIVSGIGYIAFGLGAGAVVAFASLSPLLIQAVAGLALVATLTNALQTALNAGEARDAAMLTFLVTASGIAILGVSSAFWGLLAGGVILATRWRSRAATVSSPTARPAAERRPAPAASEPLPGSL